MDKKKLNKELIIAELFTLLLTISAFYDFFYKDGEKLFRIILNFLTVAGVYLLYIKSFLKGCKIIYYINMTFVFLSVKHVRLREPVFLFLACLTVPWPYPQGLAKENTAAKRG